ncbi:MAG TPA: hypothetical protein ENK18_13965 [Deltaproteobacteria bacterium]|nr:hypothetical protein [Deltaproteobacteria bacterium]
MITLLLTHWTPAVAQSLQIEIDDPKIAEVVLACADGELRAEVRDGLASFMRSPSACQVHLIQRIGEIDAPGRWRCSTRGCSLQDVEHRPITNADGRINVIINTEIPPSTTLELTCPGSYRRRERIELNTAVFEDVPADECTLLFKGGVPAKYRPMTWGTYYCGLSGNTVICSRS